MKKFLTVLLVIAVMFTFSFSSAFATVDWTGEATSKYLTEKTDFTAPASTTDNDKTDDDHGEEGITEAYRAQLTKTAKAQLKTIKENKNVAGVVTGVTEETFYAPEKTKAVSLYEAYIENLKTVKTAKDAKVLEEKLVNAVGELDDKYGDYDKAFTDAKAEVSLEITRLNDRNKTEKDYYLPGYGVIAYNDAKSGTVALDAKTFVKDWLFDNDYRATKAEITSGTKALVSALVIMTETYTDGIDKEKGAIVDEIYKYVDRSADMRYGLPASDAEGVDALVKKINEFNEKYYGLTVEDGKVVDEIANADFIDIIKGTNDGKHNAEKKSLAANYFDQYYNEVSVVPEVKKLTDADKATVIALYKKVNALLDTYEDTWDFVGIDAITKDYAYGYDKLEAAYEHFINADVKAFNDLEKFTEMKKVGTAPNQKAYFDASEKNVTALKAKRAAYDALVSNYGYSDLAKVASPAYGSDDAIDDEALILAAEHNMTADAGYDAKDVTKLQNYLNNATLKVTTTALGNTKIRVQARFDAETYKDIVAECGNDYTISYKFYHKTAKATAFKGPKEKDRNYITYTKLSLKKGVKYKFQCGVVIKDAQGNVVAEKSYKASTTGSRVCR